MNDNAEDIGSELRQVAKGTGISGLGSFGLWALQLALGYVLAHTLGERGVGVYSLANNVVRFTQKIAVGGLNVAALRYASTYEAKEEPAKVKGVLVYCILVSAVAGAVLLVVLSAGAESLCNRLFHSAETGKILRIMALAVPLFAVFEVVTNAATARRTITPATVSTLAFEGTLLAAFGLLWLARPDIWAVQWAYVIAALVSLIVGFRFLLRLFPVLLDRQVRPTVSIRELLLFAFPLMLMGLATFGISRLDILLAGLWCSEADVGVYAIAHSLAFFGAFGLGQVAAVFRPIISDLHSRQQMAKLGAIFKVATRWVVTISLPICLFLIVQRQELLGVFGKGFERGHWALAILAGAHIVNASVGHVGWMLIMSGRSWLALVNDMVAVAANIGLAYLLIPLYGIVGAAVAAAGGLALANLLRLVEVWLIMGLSPYSMSILKPYIAGLVAAGAAWFIPLEGLFGLAVCLLVCMTVYVGILWLLGFSKTDNLVLQRIARLTGLGR